MQDYCSYSVSYTHLQWTPQYSIPRQEETEAAIKGSDNQGICLLYTSLGVRVRWMAPERKAARRLCVGGNPTARVVSNQEMEGAYPDVPCVRTHLYRCGSHACLLYTSSGESAKHRA